MGCPDCSFDNPAGSVFCQQCGTRLTAPASSGAGGCGRCGAHNPPHMRFCVECGNELGAEEAAGPTAAACPQCKKEGDPGAKFCKFCGTPYESDSPAPQAEPRASGKPAKPTRARSTKTKPTKTKPTKTKPTKTKPTKTKPSKAQSAHDDRSEADAPARLVAVLKDGSDGRVVPLFDEVTDLGRSEGTVVLADDPYLSPRHARISRRNGSWFVRDLDSVNGVFARIREPADLHDGDMILLGQQVLKFETLSDGELPLGPANLQGVLAFGTPETPRVARLVQYTTEGVGRDVHYLYRDETVLGRENGDIVFTDDPFLSRKHAAITCDRRASRFVLRDLGSSNGTAVRCRSERELSDGDQFRIGRHLFRLDVLEQGPRNHS